MGSTTQETTQEEFVDGSGVERLPEWGDKWGDKWGKEWGAAMTAKRLNIVLAMLRNPRIATPELASELGWEPQV